MRTPVDVFMDEVDKKWRSNKFKHQSKRESQVIGNSTKVYLFYHLIKKMDLFVLQVTYRGDFQTKHIFELSCSISNNEKHLDHKTKEFSSYCEKNQKKIRLFYQHFLNSFQNAMSENKHFRLHQLMYPETFQNQIQEDCIEDILNINKNEIENVWYQKIKQYYDACKTLFKKI